eukprot:TCONS_00017649-protein
MEGWSLPNSIFILIISILYVLSAIIAAFGNTFSLIVLLQPSQRSKSNKVLTSLGASDCLIGYVCYPAALWFFNHIDHEVSALFKKVAFLVGTWIICCSIFSIVFITYDRYTRITKPFQYHEIITNRRINIILISIWVGHLITSFLCTLNNTF